MITVIAGTDRHDSSTLRAATLYYKLLAEKHTDTKLLSLEGKEVYRSGPALTAIENEYLIPAEKFVFIMPEYNGSFPGILKLMMDHSDIKRCWWGKKAALVGVADGRAGNLRGLDHMTNILNYLKVLVLPNKIPISKINDIIDKQGNLTHTATGPVLEQQMAELLAL